MTNKEIGETLAQFDGWVYHDSTSETGDVETWRRGNEVVYGHCPDYVGDLNAIHEIEKKLDKEKNIIPEEKGFQSQMDRYIELLEQEVEATNSYAEEDLYAATIMAPPEVRARALVKTIDKWKA